jgi:hypothetical protein
LRAYLKNDQSQKGWGCVAQMVEHFLIRHEAEFKPKFFHENKEDI